MKILKMIQELCFFITMDSKDEFNGTLSPIELNTDRWGKGKFVKLGTSSRICDNVTVFGKVSVGKNRWIGPFKIFDGSGGSTIGDKSFISTGIQIYTHNTIKWTISGRNTLHQNNHNSIGNNCYVGPKTKTAKVAALGDKVIVRADGYFNRSLNSNKKMQVVLCDKYEKNF